MFVFLALNKNLENYAYYAAFLSPVFCYFFLFIAHSFLQSLRFDFLVLHEKVTKPLIFSGVGF
jgi:hypothetical protein